MTIKHPPFMAITDHILGWLKAICCNQESDMVASL